MTKLGLTVQQRSLLQFIRSYADANGVPPSFDEMMRAMGLKSKSGIHRLVTALEDRGHIVRGWGARSIRVIEDGGIDTADALRVVMARCKMSREASQEISRLLAAEVGS